jgi:hypothetical protein
MFLPVDLLGKRLAEQRDVPGMKVVLQQLTDWGQANQMPMIPIIVFRLGEWLAELGDAAGAVAAYRQVINSGRPMEALMAGRSLYEIQAKQGEAAAARGAALQQVVESGHATVAPTLGYRLGETLAQHGEVAAAGVIFGQVIDSGHNVMAPQAQRMLQVLKNGRRTGRLIDRWRARPKK